MTVEHPVLLLGLPPRMARSSSSGLNPNITGQQHLLQQQRVEMTVTVQNRLKKRTVMGFVAELRTCVALEVPYQALVYARPFVERAVFARSAQTFTTEAECIGPKGKRTFTVLLQLQPVADPWSFCEVKGKFGKLQSKIHVQLALDGDGDDGNGTDGGRRYALDTPFTKTGAVTFAIFFDEADMAPVPPVKYRKKPQYQVPR